jgi:hypothetical protein
MAIPSSGFEDSIVVGLDGIKTGTLLVHRAGSYPGFGECGLANQPKHIAENFYGLCSMLETYLQERNGVLKEFESEYVLALSRMIAYAEYLDGETPDVYYHYRREHWGVWPKGANYELLDVFNEFDYHMQWYMGLSQSRYRIDIGTHLGPVPEKPLPPWLSEVVSTLISYPHDQPREYPKGQ